MGTNEFQVLMVMIMKNAFRYLTPCSLLDRYRRISGSHGDEYEESLPVSDAV